MSQTTAMGTWACKHPCAVRTRYAYPYHYWCNRCEKYTQWWANDFENKCGHYPTKRRGLSLLCDTCADSIDNSDGPFHDELVIQSHYGPKGKESWSK